MYLITPRFVHSRLLTTSIIRCNRSCVTKNSVLTLLQSYDKILTKSFILPKNSEVDNLKMLLIQVVGSGGDCVPGNVILVSNGKRYLINCGEGTQRLGNEYKMNLEKIQNVFITYPSWKNMSGLVGLNLAVDKSRRSGFLVHGDKCIDTLFCNGSKTVPLKNLLWRFNKCYHYGKFSDDSISVQYVFHYPSMCQENIKKNSSDSSIVMHKKSSRIECASSSGEECNLNHGKLHNPHTSKKKEYEIIPEKKNRTQRSHSEKNAGTEVESEKAAVSFIFETPITTGTLIVEKCFEFGVPPGPLMGLLKSGHDVTLEDGRIVKSEDVKSPDLPGQSIIAVECPSENYLDSFLEEPIFSNYQSREKAATVIIHFTSSQIVKHRKYQQWINNFPKDTKHLFINENNASRGSVGIYRQQFKLNYLSSNIFPKLSDSKIPEFPRLETSTNENGHTVVPCDKPLSNPNPVYSDTVCYKCENNSFVNGETLCTFYLRPKKQYDYSKCLVLKHNEFLSEMFKNNMEENIQRSKQELEQLEKTLEQDSREYPKIVFLGTGSSGPGKVRNPSGILIFVEKNKCMLLDCGENTYNQMVIFYGKKRAGEILRMLKVIFISHLHIDHHMGLITVLKERKHAFDELNESDEETSEKITFHPVIVLAPLHIQKWLMCYNEFEEILHLFQLISNLLFIEGCKENFNAAEIYGSLNLELLLTAGVIHCPYAFAITMIHKDGWKLTYSGDTLPCEALVKLGKNSDILIHEATFQDAYFMEAKLKMHCTTSQAITIGQKMKAKYILLTHFSQRYSVIPVIEEEFKNLNVGIAFDFMEVSFNKLPLLPALLQPLQYIFSEYDERLKLQSQSERVKRNLKEKRVFLEAEELNNERPVKILKSSFEN